ncbi:hypothetical protein J7T55_000781 [Diaporthe amygdali]|uniref:uncharacterized protein n=1 Tax=Phomopsis amygdali TaxID=1214568 RepID=UPI0022FDDDB4|nr:uncharacterized protein J7T55_000781 [Diaporthe amygdali]KAJ0119931.1 hypothetical protein J7T55_000781 [Diaporthe amygdali]
MKFQGPKIVPEERHFTPSVATLEQLHDFEASIGVQHVCIAHGLSYGPDCTSLLYYLEQLQGRARGICVIDEESVTDEQLNKYHAAGVRSVRLDFHRAKAMNDEDRQVELIEATAARLRGWDAQAKGWSIQIQQPHLGHWKRLRQIASVLGVPLVVDHMSLVKGQSMAAEGQDAMVPVVDRSEWQELLGALRDGNVWIKISAPYRNSRLEPSFEDLEEIVKQLVRANPKRFVWGSDWPHTQRHEDRAGRDPKTTEPFLKVDNPSWIRSLGGWLSDKSGGK